jgi:XTP/dITP diphosphohydrolase
MPRGASLRGRRSPRSRLLVIFAMSLGEKQLVGDRFEFFFSDIPTDEPLEVDLATMVRRKAVSAYRALLTPCIVEHAGLIFQKHASTGFPGGLTQPMLDSLGPEEFLRRTSSRGERATARAVIGYCDGMCVRIFVGETSGTIAGEPRGAREFYWDTIFQPDDFGGKTYAEISGDPARGIPAKMQVSQSMKALGQFLETRLRNGGNPLFPDL